MHRMLRLLFFLALFPSTLQLTQSLRNVYAMAIPAGILVGVAAALIRRVNVKQMGISVGAAA
jgi:hypothetical protein